MTALLDTYALRWWFDGSTNLPADVRNLISDRSATIGFLSWSHGSLQ